MNSVSFYQQPLNCLATISIVHATWHRARSPVEVREVWLTKAEHPELIEYVFAVDADDELSLVWTTGCQRVVSPADPRSTTVRNWNAAAKLTSGELLVVVADDLFPPMHWDKHLRRIVQGLSPSRQAFAIKVTDSPSHRDTLMRHPVISRALFERNGLFDPRFRGVYCDDDITLTCFWRYAILDGRELVLDHRHPALDESITQSASQTRQNQTEEYRHGAAVLKSKWSVWKRRATVRLIQVPSTGRLSWSYVRRTSALFRIVERILAPLRIAERTIAFLRQRGQSNLKARRQPE